MSEAEASFGLGLQLALLVGTRGPPLRVVWAPSEHGTSEDLAPEVVGRHLPRV